MRGPPEKLPPKFPVGSLVHHYGKPGVWRVTNIVEMSKEWLVRTAYAAGYYTYDVERTDGSMKGSNISENIFTSALIEQLGEIADGA
jgi:hypothetical protein